MRTRIGAMTHWLRPRTLAGWLRPRTLAGQTILVVAASLLAVQVIGFGAYYFAQRGQWLTVAAAPGVIRILDAVDPLDRATGWQRQRAMHFLTISSEAPAQTGKASPAIAERAREMFASAGIKPLAVRAALEHRPTNAAPPPHRFIHHNRRPSRLRVQLSVEISPKHWLTTYSRAAPIAPPIFERIVVQTLFVFGMVLMPLVWFTRRLAAPLRALTSATKRVGTPEGARSVPEIGPEDVKQLAAAFNIMQDRIRSMLEEKDHMLGAIGHDLRTPLTALRVRVESVPDTADRERMIATIDDMRQMLDDILALARAGRDREPPQRADLAALALAAIEDFQDTGGAVSHDDLPRAIVRVHPRAIRRALTNLIDNALKYGREAQVSLHTEGGKAILSVADLGPGIAPERIEEMMQPFTRLERSRSRDTGGTGLGLAIVRAVVSAEAGHIELSNRPEGGLLAQISLPIEEVPRDA